MGRNVEIKARARDFARQRRLALELADNAPADIWQRDTFFSTEKGRLKLRELAPDAGELIHYERPDTKGPRESRYEIFRTREPAALVDVLGQALGVRGVVEKRRTLLLAGQTRIHLDEVTGLGDFLELEVVLTEDQTTADGERLAKELMDRLEIHPGDLVDRAYIDLLEKT